MSSGQAGSKGFDSIVKLWISLWHLILEDKRHYESVRATLQSLVFGATKWPTFKNWAAICEIGRSDPLMMMVLATLDLSDIEKDPVVANIVAAFPTCFSEVKCGNGPYPLSVIRADAAAGCRSSDRSCPEGAGCDYPVAHDAVPDDVPVQVFYWGKGRSDYDIPNLPEELVSQKNLLQGSTLNWGGKKFVVLENNDGMQEIAIAPAECIAVDL